MSDAKVLRLGIPKGSLQDSTLEIFAKAGFKIRISSRSYYPSIDDTEIECTMVRAQEMARYVGDGILDCGLTGRDWVLESGADVQEISELEYAKSTLTRPRWVLAVHEDSPVQSVTDLAGKRIATEVMEISRKYLAQHGVTAQVEFSWGATEVKIPKLADAIIEITETGSSLRANQLRIVDTVLETVTVFIANRESWKDEWKQRKIEQILLLVRGALHAQKMVGLMLNVKQSDLKRVLSLLPSLKNPTVSQLSDPEWYDIMTVLDELSVRTLIPKLKEAGAVGIVEFPLNKVIE